MGKHKDLSDFDEDQIVIDKQISQRISGLVYAMINTYQKFQGRKLVNWQEDMITQDTLMHVESCLVGAHKRATVTQIVLKKWMLA